MKLIFDSFFKGHGFKENVRTLTTALLTFKPRISQIFTDSENVLKSITQISKILSAKVCEVCVLNFSRRFFINKKRFINTDKKELDRITQISNLLSAKICRICVLIFLHADLHRFTQIFFYKSVL